MPPTAACFDAPFPTAIILRKALWVYVAVHPLGSVLGAVSYAASQRLEFRYPRGGPLGVGQSVLPDLREVRMARILRKPN